MVELATNGKKVLWAIDAFPSHPEFSTQSLKAVKALLEGIAASIEPVYVFRPAPPGLFIQAPPGMSNPAEGLARQHVAKFVKELKLSRVTSPTFLHAEFSSTASQVKCLTDYARAGGFDLIVAGTHARKGVSRLFMGSFAERLVQDSPLPVLLSSPLVKIKPKESLKHIFFPTDFSPESFEVLQRVVALAKQTDAELVLFHQMEYISPQFGYPFVVPPVSQESLNEMRRECTERLEEWASGARRSGVRTRIQVAEDSGETAQAILRAAAKLPSCVIALASQSGRVEGLLLGSVARKVLRAADRPVYLMHPVAPRTVDTGPAALFSPGYFATLG